MKRCRGCEKDLPPEMFRPRRATCNDCKRAQGRAYYQRTKRTDDSIEIPPDVPNIYANSAGLRMSVHDVILSLNLAEPQGNRTRTKLVARIFMSPQHAKALSRLLQQQVEVYEAAFGPIPEDRSKIGTGDENTSTEPGAANGTEAGS